MMKSCVTFACLWKVWIIPFRVCPHVLVFLIRSVTLTDDVGDVWLTPGKDQLLTGRCKSLLIPGERQGNLGRLLQGQHIETNNHKGPKATVQNERPHQAVVITVPSMGVSVSVNGCVSPCVSPAICRDLSRGNPASGPVLCWDWLQNPCATLKGKCYG